MKRLFEYRAYRKVFKLTAEQCNQAFAIAASLMLLKTHNA